MSPRRVVPAIEGWFTMDPLAPALVGSRCPACGTYAFPAAPWCANPACAGTPEPCELSRRGTIWSYTDARYAPPPPYEAADPYVPFALCAVELPVEKMVVLGQLADGWTTGDLSVGDEVELVLGTLHQGPEADVVTWKWQPLRPPAPQGGGTR